MKVVVSKKVYDQLDESRHGLAPIPCDCIKDDEALPGCESCNGGGVVYEMLLSTEEAAAIQQNLRNQGVPLGKTGSQ